MFKKIRKKYKYKILRKHKPRVRKLYIVLFLSVTILVFIVYSFLVQFENYVLPSAIEISEKYAVNVVNKEINKSVEQTIERMEIYSGDFLQKNFEEGEETKYLDIDTILINSVCYNVSNILTENLENISDTKIDLPIGIFSGMDAFANLGPAFKVTISSIGNSTVDYETKFEAVGINQINFQVYLNINTSVSIVNPLYKENIEVSRKLMLVNTVFNGEVPDTYLNMEK